MNGYVPKLELSGPRPVWEDKIPPADLDELIGTADLRAKWEDLLAEHGRLRRVLVAARTKWLDENPQHNYVDRETWSHAANLAMRERQHELDEAERAAARALLDYHKAVHTLPGVDEKATAVAVAAHERALAAYEDLVAAVRLRDVASNFSSRARIPVQTRDGSLVVRVRRELENLGPYIRDGFTTERVLAHEVLGDGSEILSPEQKRERLERLAKLRKGA